MTEDIAPELLEEARKRRAQEAALAAFDRELEETRRRVLRPRPGQARLDRAIREAQAAAELSPEGAGHFPEASVRALGELSDRLEGQAERVDALADRVDALVEELEAASLPALPSAPIASAQQFALQSPLERFAGLVQVAVDRLSGARGPVLHSDCRDGALVARLTAAGVAAYGTDPSAALVQKPAVPGLDLRQADAAGHLRSLAAGDLGGVLLSGCVDRVSVGDARRLAFLLGTRLAQGAPAVVVGTQPESWQREASPVERDLAPGRPLHAETWCHLLGEYGFVKLETVDGSAHGAFLVTGTRAGQDRRPAAAPRA